MSTHIPVNRKHSKRPPRRCTVTDCAQLTRHNTQHCPDPRRA
ncbi:hypothetical protein AB9M10_15635 [Rhodococcus erythropolis]